MNDQSLEKSVRFISDTLKETPETNRLKLIEEASRRFNLSPVQAEHLLQKYVYSR